MKDHFNCLTIFQIRKEQSEKKPLATIILSAVHAMHWYDDDDDDDMILSSIDLQSLFGISHSHLLSGLAVITKLQKN